MKRTLLGAALIVVALCASPFDGGITLGALVIGSAVLA